MRDTRLHLDQPLDAGRSVGLDAAATHYLKAVLRARQGHRLRVFNAEDGEWRARLTLLDRHAATLEVEARLRAAVPEPGPALLFAPLKKARLDWLLEKATELGVARLQPVSCRHAVVEGTKPERLRQRIVEAVEQSERLSVPVLLPEVALEAAVEAASDGVVMADEAGGAPLLPTLAAHPAAALLVGPEGGFAEAERSTLRRLTNVFPVGLGPFILRAETAALVLLACHRARATADSVSRRAMP
jgi:16S rRNA (uracil1498-N3)-methyltransferase